MQTQIPQRFPHSRAAGVHFTSPRGLERFGVTTINVAARSASPMLSESSVELEVEVMAEAKRKLVVRRLSFRKPQDDTGDYTDSDADSHSESDEEEGEEEGTNFHDEGVLQTHAPAESSAERLTLDGESKADTQRMMRMMMARDTPHSHSQHPSFQPPPQHTSVTNTAGADTAGAGSPSAAHTVRTAHGMSPQEDQQQAPPPQPSPPPSHVPSYAPVQGPVRVATDTGSEEREGRLLRELQEAKEDLAKCRECNAEKDRALAALTLKFEAAERSLGERLFSSHVMSSKLLYFGHENSAFRL